MNIRLEGRASRGLGVTCIAIGLVLNAFVIGPMVSSRGRIESPTVNVCIIVFQCVLIGIGCAVYVRRPNIVLSRRSIAVLFLMIFALQAAARLFLPNAAFLDSILKSGYQRNDLITTYEARFDCLRNGLPRNGVVGYATSDRVRDDETAFKYHYQVTQYSIAPVVLENSIHKNLVIGNLLDSLSLRGRLDDNCTALIKDCGGGVVLLRGCAAERF